MLYSSAQGCWRCSYPMGRGSGGDAAMILITYQDPAKWPVKLNSATDCYEHLAEGAKQVMIEGDDLLLVAAELTGIPLMRYINDWDKMIWHWTDAQFIISNIKQAFLINKEHTQVKRK